MEILRYFTRPGATANFKPDYGNAYISENNQHDSSGSEWVEIDEPGGLFMPRMKRRRHLLQLDQVHNVIHYDKYRQCMRIQDIALITAVEEVDDDGHFQWWMSIQDASTVQVWIVRFSSLYRLQSWVHLLRSVTAATNTRALISDVVLSNTACVQNVLVSPTSSSKETILEMHPEQY